MTRPLHRLTGRVFGWFDCKAARLDVMPLPAKFRAARLALTNLEDRSVPATLVVNTTADTIDNTDGLLSLREALETVNFASDATLSAAEKAQITGTLGTNDKITFAAAKFPLNTTITATKSLEVAVPLQILGLSTGGVNHVTISGGGTTHLFDTLLANPGDVILFDKLNLTKGLGPSGTLTIGGALSVGDEDVTLTNCSLTANTADCGGAINVSGLGKLTLQNCTVTGNLGVSTTTYKGGGAIYVLTRASTTIQNSVISGNKSNWGGGILHYAGGDLDMLNCTVSGNTATGGSGGGIYFFGVGYASKIAIRNTTVSGNSCPGSGGGIFIRSLLTASTVAIRNSTITLNTCSSTSTAAGRGGGGLSVSGNKFGNWSMTIESTIISGNTHTAAAAKHDFSSASTTTVTLTKSAIGVTTGMGFTPDGTNNLIGKALNLDPTLKVNGGGTPTHALIFPSPAIDFGSNSTGLATDQRGTGFAREVPVGFPDVGAFERVPGTPGAVLAAPLVTVTADDASTNPYKFSVTYSDDTAINVSTIGDGDVIVTGPGGFTQAAKFLSLDVPGNGTPRTATYQITPPGGTWDVGDNGDYTLTVGVDEVKSTSGISVPASVLGTFNVGFVSTFIVTTDADAGPGSLRDAIDKANASKSTLDTILFDPTFFATKKTIALASDLPIITDKVIISGPGANIATVSGEGQYRAINTTGAPGGAPITISGLTLTNCAPPVDNGGAVRIGDEAVTLQGMVISNNKAIEGGGINIAFAGAKLTIIDSIIRDNTANFDGGGINITAKADLVVHASTISGNSCQSDGGGIYFQNSGTFLMTRSTVSGNTANGSAGTFNNGGAGIYFYGTIGAAGFIISNSTISGNHHTVLGGAGLCFVNTTGVPQIRNSTIVNNTANGNGGGIAGLTLIDTLTIVSSIVADNTSVFGAGQDLNFGVGFVNATFSAVGSDDAGSLNDYAGAGKNNIPLNTPLNLGPLANNGGPTLTHLPGPGPLINKGSNPFPLSPNVDQVGNPRENGQADIGAVEVPASISVSGFTVNGGNPQRSRITSVTVNFSSPVDAALFQPAGAITFTRTAATPTGTVGTVVDTSNGLIVSPASGSVSSLTLTFANILNPGVENGSLADGRWQLAVVPAGFTSTPGDVNLRRLFGDNDANGTVDGNDFSNFGTAFGGASVTFDFDNNGTIDGTDFGAFGARFGLTL